jgi:hypothetical protein
MPPGVGEMEQRGRRVGPAEQCDERAPDQVHVLGDEEGCAEGGDAEQP